MIVGFKKSHARVIVVLQYGSSSLKLLPDDAYCLPVNYTAQVMAGLEGILDAHQMTVISNTSCPALLLLATHRHGIAPGEKKVHNSYNLDEK
jgi:hypothetical protein